MIHLKSYSFIYFHLSHPTPFFLTWTCWRIESFLFSSFFSLFLTFFFHLEWSVKVLNIYFLHFENYFTDESMLRIKESASPGWSQGSPFSGTESIIPSPNSRDSSSPQSSFPSFFPSFPISRKRLTSEDNKIGEVDLKKHRGSSDVKCKDFVHRIQCTHLSRHHHN